MDFIIPALAVIILALAGRTGSCYDDSVELITQDLYCNGSIVKEKDKKKSKKKKEAREPKIVAAPSKREVKPVEQKEYSTISNFDADLSIDSLVEQYKK